MSQSYEPHRLAIQHLSVLESAPEIVAEVEKKVFAAIDAKIEDWVKLQNNWEGVYNYIEEELSFKPKYWEKDENEDYCAYYCIGCETGEDYEYSLSPLLGVVPDKYGIWFRVDARWVTGLSGKGVNAAWKKYLAERFAQTKLKELDFQLEGDSLYLPIHVDANVLANDYPDSLDTALEPFNKALERLEAAHPEIDTLLKDTRDYSFGKQMQIGTAVPA